MQADHLHREYYSAHPLLVDAESTAHSGPELIGSLPNPTLASHVASSIVAGCVEMSDRPDSSRTAHTFSDVRIYGIERR